MDDLRAFVAAALHLQSEARDMVRWEVEADHAEKAIRCEDPAAIGRACREVAGTYAATSAAFGPSATMHTGIRERARSGSAIPGGDALAVEQADEAQELGERFIRLRGRLRALDGAIGDALAELRDQDVETRLLRLAPTDGSMRTLAELEGTVRNDHYAIADAMGDWRLMHRGGAVMTIADSTPRTEIAAALKAMEKAGTAVRLGTAFVGHKWTFPTRDATRKAA